MLTRTQTFKQTFKQKKQLARVVGADSESRALQYLRQQHLKLIAQNFYSRFGEIDLIMQDKTDIVFIEVKMRAKGYGDAIESITTSKQKKIILTARYYLQKYCRSDPCCRFDAVILNGFDEIIWLKNVIMLS